MTILIAEDGADQARILMAVLKKAGHTLVWFQTGAEAYEYLTLNPPPDLLITDVMMPGMSGFELLLKLKEIHLMPPTIMLTGRQREDDVLRGIKLGVLDYITKPFSPSVIAAKIENVLQRKAG